MNDSTRRAIRTVLDLVPGVVAALLVMVPVLGLPAAKVAAVSGFLGAVIVAAAKIRNTLEDAGIIPALLKAPASSGENPLPDPGPARDSRGRFAKQGGYGAIELLVFVVIIVILLRVLHLI